jgi:lysophospholipase L1-like esterase
MAPVRFSRLQVHSTAFRAIACQLMYAMFIAVSAFASGPSGPTADEAPSMQWFRAEVSEGSASGWFRLAIDPAVTDSESVELTMATNGHCSLYVNGQRILKHASLKQSDGSVAAAGYDVKSLLRQGRNSLAVEVNSETNTAVFGLSIKARKGAESQSIAGPWKMAPAAPPVGWTQTDFNDRDWQEAKPVADEPGTRLTFLAPEKFAAPVIPAKARTAPFQFEDGDRVVFVGATFFERSQLSEHIEATLTGTLGDKHITFRNLGWSADTVFADSRGIFDRPDVGYLRMVEHVRAEEPTVAFICYGQNEALTAGLSPEQYSQQLGRLLDELAASGIACILVSPHELLPTLPPIPSPSRFNPKLKVFSEATASVAQSRGLLFVDLFTDFTQQLQAISTAISGDPSQASGRGKPSDFRDLSENGMHLTEHGYACASAILRERLLNIPATLPSIEVDVKNKSVTSTSAKIRNVKWEPNGGALVTFEFLETHLSPFPTMLTLDRSDSKSAAVQGGTVLSGERSDPLQVRDTSREHSQTLIAPVNPQYEAVRQLLLKKNELYFHRWRPQNITYLFGFRKHEQGNNAADIAKFDPFIQDLEMQIHELQKPQWRTVNIQLR